MLDLRETEKFLTKAGKYRLSWERDEEFNYVSDGNALVKLPRYDVLSDEESDMLNFYLADEKEKLLKCERVLYYHFMTPPEIGQSLKKQDNLVQYGIQSSLKSMLFNNKLISAQKTGLRLGSSVSIFASDMGYTYFDSRYIGLIEDDDKTFMLTTSKALIYAKEYMSILIASMKMDSDNMFLKVPEMAVDYIEQE